MVLLSCSCLLKEKFEHFFCVPITLHNRNTCKTLGECEKDCGLYSQWPVAIVPSVFLILFSFKLPLPITQKQHKKCLMVSLNGIKLIIASYLENQANLMNKRMVCINNRKKYIKRKLILLLRKGLNVISTEYHCSQSNSSICGMLLDFKKKITLKAKGLGE